MAIAAAGLGMTGCGKAMPTPSPPPPTNQPILPTIAVSDTLDEEDGSVADGLLFRASFDWGAEADHATTAEEAIAPGVRFWRVLGSGGHAMVAYPGSLIQYPGVQGIFPQQGTIELGVKPLQGFHVPQPRRWVTIRDAASGNAISVESWPGKTFHLSAVFRVGLYEYLEVVSEAIPEWQIGDWHHVAIAWGGDENVVGLYSDGLKVGGDEFSTVFSGSQGKITIGGREDALSEPSHSAFSEIDEVRIYDRARSPSEIEDDFREYDMDKRGADVATWSPGTPGLLSSELVSQPDLMFVVLTDTHILEQRKRPNYKTVWRVEHLLDQMKRLQPDFVVNCGDILAVSPFDPKFMDRAQEALRVHDELGAPVHYVAGNHDIGNKPLWSHNTITDDTVAQYVAHFGPDYYSFDVEDCHFVVLDSQLLNSGLPAAAMQWQWLMDDLESSHDHRLNFMFFHLVPFWGDQDDPGPLNYETIDEPARSELLKLISNYRIDAVFTGHTHHPFTNVIGKTEFVTVQSASFSRPHLPNHGVPNQATIYDEWRVGYKVVRVYPHGHVVNSVETFPRMYPSRTLQVGNDLPPKRFLNRTAAELDDGLLGLVSAPVPPIDLLPWDPSFALDGAVGEGIDDDRWHGWASSEHSSPLADEWIAVDLTWVESINRVEFAPVFAQNYDRFPVDFVVEISTDGSEWIPVVEEQDYPPPGGLVSFEFPPQPARYVRLRSTRMRFYSVAPPHYGYNDPPYRMSIMEFRIFGTDGVNYAPEGQSFAQSNNRLKRSVDDLAWQLPSRVGSKWVRISPREYEWSAMEPQAGTNDIGSPRDRALSMGMPRGVKMVMPLTTHNRVYADGELGDAFASYVWLLCERYADRIAAWEVVHSGQTAQAFAGLVQRARDEISAIVGDPFIVAGAFPPDDDAMIGALADKADAVVVEMSLDGMLSGGTASTGTQLEGVVQRVRECCQNAGQPKSSLETWVQIVCNDLPHYHAHVIAKHVAREFIAAQALGVRFFWGHAVGNRTGLLDEAYDPNELYYTVQILTTLFDASVRPLADFRVEVLGATSGVQTYMFAGGDRLTIACWQTRNPSDESTAEAVELVFEDRPCQKVMAINTLSCSGQDLVWHREADGIHVSDVSITDYPTVLVL